MKLNEEKCHLLVFGEKDTEISINVGPSVIKESKEEKLLGVVIDHKLNFKQHLDTVCRKASHKLHALARASTYMPKEKTRMVMRAFIMSHFSYYPLIWMFHDRRVNTKINYIHERALRIAYQDRTSSFEELLITDNSVSIHQQNLQLLVTEIYRTRINLNPPFMKEIFVEREVHYNLRVMYNIYARKPRTTAYGLENVSLLGQNNNNGNFIYFQQNLNLLILYQSTSSLITGRDTTAGYQGKRKIPKSSITCLNVQNVL